MTQSKDYIDLAGRLIPLDDLDASERRLIARLKRRAKSDPNWDDFENFWMPAVAEFYSARRYTRPQTIRTAAWRIAQDLSSRLAISAGLARLPDYRDELEELIRTQFATRRAFCKATGLSEDMLS